MPSETHSMLEINAGIELFNGFCGYRVRTEKVE